MSKPTNRNEHTRKFAELLADLCKPATRAVSECADNFERVWITTAEGADLRITIEDESLELLPLASGLRKAGVR